MKTIPNKLPFGPCAIQATAIEITDPVQVDFVCAYSGGKLQLSDFELPVVIDLDSCTVHDNIPILLNHDPLQRVGTIKHWLKKNGTLAMQGIIIPALTASKEVLTVHKNGGAWECSIGTGSVEIDKQKIVMANETEMVNGQTFRGPLIAASDIEIREISFVPAGADARTKLTIHASALSHDKEYNTMTFEEFATDLGLDLNTLDEANKASLKSKFDAEQAKNIQATDGDPAPDEPNPDDKKIQAADGDCTPNPIPDEDKNIQATDGDPAPNPDDKKIQASKLRTMDALRSVNIPGYGRTVDEGRVIQASMLMARQVNPKWLEKDGFTQQEINEAMSKNYRGCSLHGLMRRSIQASGLRLSPFATARELVRTYHESIQAAGLSTRNWSPVGIMHAVTDRLLRVETDQIVSVTDKILYPRSVKNFNPVMSGKLNIDAKFTDVKPGEDFPNAMLSDSSQQYQIAKKGINLSITIEDQYNDDLGAIDRGVQQFTRVFANHREKTFMDMLLSQSSTLFTTANKKKAALAFSVENLKKVVGQFKRMKNNNGDFRNLIPGQILCSPETAIQASSIFEWNNRNLITADVNNVINAVYDVFDTPYLTEAQGWFLLPKDEKIGEMASLEGNSAPSVERAAVNTKNLNIEILIWGTAGFLLYNDAPAVMSVPA